MAGWYAGGIRALLDLIEEHRPALEYDWRTRFRLGLHEIGTAMGWGEAYRLALTLIRDPGSHLCASVGGWRSPWSQEAELLAQLLEVTTRANSKRPGQVKPYPRPWVDIDATTTAKPTLPQPVVRAVLRRARDGGIQFSAAVAV